MRHLQAARGASLSSGAPRRLVILVLCVALDALVLDILTKQWAVARLGTDPVELGPLTLRLVRNPGAAFGLARGATVVLTLVALAVVVVVIRSAPRLTSRTWAVAYGLVLGGALGNLVDRMLRAPGPLRGHVVDFIDLGWWPVFNVADIAISVGAATAVLLTLRGVEATRAPDALPDSAPPNNGFDQTTPDHPTSPGETGQDDPS